VTIGIAGAGGHFELNAMMPVIAWNLLHSIRILASACDLLAGRAVAGLGANRERCRELVERSLAMVTALVPRIGYDRAAAIAREAMATGRTVRELCLEQAVLPPDELASALDPWVQTEGGVQTG
jgi:fumarate hydratase class II